jgi:hypothetical protein
MQCKKIQCFLFWEAAITSPVHCSGRKRFAV